MHSSTAARGSTYRTPPTFTSRPSMMARVNGRVRRNAVPSPGRLVTSMRPRRASTRSRTTSSPTPRPESVPAVSRVEKPGSKIRRNSVSGSGRASEGSMFRATARFRTASASMPAPSSAMRMATLPPAWRAEMEMRPVSGFPAAFRSAGGSMPWSRQFRSRWTIGSRRPSMTLLSNSVSPPAVRNVAGLPSRSERS